MLRILLRLWWLRIRRQFKKRDLAVAIYFLFVYVAVCIGFYVGYTSAGATLELGDGPAFVGYIVVLAMLIPDIIMKMSMKHDVSVMDDYLKSRPIPERAWNSFLLIVNMASVWNYIIPVMFLPFMFLIVSPVQALASFMVMLFFSYADSLFVTCFHRTSDRFLHFSLIAGWLVMAMEIALFIAFTFWASAWVENVGLLLLSVAVIAGLVAFLANEDNYDESRGRAARQRGFGRVTLFTMQFFGVIRAKRLRNMVLLVAVIFLFDAYLYAWTSEPGDLSTTVNAILAVVFPSIVMSQWTFGVEANFFQGLMSKPITVRRLLTNSFYFYILLSLACALLVLPLTFISPEFSALMLVAALCVSVFLSLFNLPTCLFSTRLELFSNSFFNMQGANMKINFYSLAMLLPLCFFAGIWYLWGATVWAVVSIIIGCVSLAIHKLVINKVAARFDARRYERIESFMS